VGERGFAGRVNPGSIPTDNVLTGVSCRSACFAVGYFINANGYRQTLIEQWTGSWSVISSPDPVQNDVLLGVSCVAWNSCQAVGYDWTGVVGGQDLPLVATWNGTTWTTPALTYPSTFAGDSVVGMDLNAVSCTGANFCRAVGFLKVQSGSTTWNVAVILKWNGTAWSTEFVRTPITSRSTFNGVSCLPAAGFCRAVGFYKVGGVEKTLIEKRSGGNWTSQVSPNVSSGTTELSSVSCWKVTLCESVGWSVSGALLRPLFVYWNGAAWAPLIELSLGNAALNGVSCGRDGATNFCVAAGYKSSGQFLIEKESGVTVR
jgi:hypothetical protein